MLIWFIQLIYWCLSTLSTPKLYQLIILILFLIASFIEQSFQKTRTKHIFLNNNFIEKHLLRTMNGKILLVEDHDGLRQLMGHYLSKSFEVVSAKNGLEAMGWLNRGISPDIILTDAEMPEITGFQLLSNLKCSGMYRHIPVFIVSGSEEPEEEHKFLKMGAVEFIRKPFNPEQLKDRLTNLFSPVSAPAKFAVAAA